MTFKRKFFILAGLTLMTGSAFAADETQNSDEATASTSRVISQSTLDGLSNLSVNLKHHDIDTRFDDSLAKYSDTYRKNQQKTNKAETAKVVKVAAKQDGEKSSDNL